MLRVAEHFEDTDTGRQRRANEDSLYARAPVFVVADGMGGAKAGEVASQIAVEAFAPGLPEEGSPEERLAVRAREANTRIHELSRSDRDRAGMGTTLTAAYVGECEVSIAHVGDSRAYLLREGELRRLTRDHSLVQALIDQQELTEEEAPYHPGRSIITRALGPEPDVEVETRTHRAQDGDVVLLCSDGLTSMVGEDAVGDVLRSSSSLRAAGRGLIAAANEAGGRDNITVVLFRLEDVDRDGKAEATGGGRRAEEQPTGSSPAVALAPSTRKGSESATAASRREPSSAARTTLHPRAPAPAPEAPPRRFRRKLAIALTVLLVSIPLLTGAWLASRQVFFLGTNGGGAVTVFRGVPYDLPGGVRLYERFYVSGVPAADVRAERRRTLLDHSLRSERDARNLVRQLELGRLSG